MMKRKNQILAVLLSASMIVGTLVQAVPVQAETQLSTYGNIANQAVITSTGTTSGSSNLVDGNDGSLYKFYDGQMSSEQAITMTYAEARSIDACRIAFEKVGTSDGNNYQFTYSIQAKNSGDVEYDTIVANATANRTDNSAQEYKFAEKTYSEIKIVMHSCTSNSASGYGWPAVAEFEVYGSETAATDASRDVDPKTMKVKAGNYEENYGGTSEGSPDYVLDGKLNTHWHTEFYPSGGGNRDNHYLIFTFGEPTKIDGMRFLQRQNVGDINGKVTKFDLYTRENVTDDWTQIINDGELSKDILWQKVNFANAVTAKEVKFQVVEAYPTEGTKYAAAAEVRFTQVDYSGIDAAIEAADAKVEAEYTGNSWTALQSALAAANAAKISATQEQIDAATATLNAAISNLVARANFTDLNSAIQEAESKKKESGFELNTDASIKNLEDELIKAKEMAENTNATQDEVTAMAQAVKKAITELELDDAKAAAKELAAAKAALNTAISTAAARLESEDISNYTEESVTSVQSALSAAQGVAEKADATKEEVDAAKTALEEAVTGLTLKDADYKAVEEAKKAAAAVDRSDKTDASLEVLDNAVKAVVEGKKITEQANVDAMAQAIMTAITELKIDEAKVAAKELAAAKAALSAQITKTQEFITANSKYDCRALEALVTEAQKLVDSETADVNSVNAKADELAATMDNFKYLYVIKVNGAVVKSAAYNTRVTITAPAADEGMKFAGWEVDGKIISTKEKYTFYIANSMNFIPTYVGDEAPVEVEPAAIISNTMLTKTTGGRANIKFVAQLVVPDGYTVTKAGFLLYNKDTTTELVKDGTIANNVKKTQASVINGSYQFSVTINNVPNSKFVRGMVYANVKNNTTGAETVIYSMEKTVYNR